MNEQELRQIKQMALNYGDPIRGKILACVAEIERLQFERNGWKKHAIDFEQMYKDEHKAKNALKRHYEQALEVARCGYES